MLPGGIFNRNYKEDLAIIRTKFQWGLLIAFLILLGLAPLFTSPHTLTVLTTAAITIIAVHGLNILLGYCGQINIANTAFMGIGAYTSANLMTKLGFPFWLALPCAGIAAGLAGAIFGIAALRVKGFYLAMATLALYFVFMYLVMNLPALTGGYAGIVVPAAQVGSLVISSERSYYFLAMGFAVIATIVTKNLVRSGVGRAFIAVRDNDKAAEAMGINLFYCKLRAFFIACFYAGIAGSLLVHCFRYASADFFVLMESIWQIGMIIVGGLGTCLGPILGVVFFTLLKELIMMMTPVISKFFPEVALVIVASVGTIVFAGVIILFLIVEPRGLAHRWELAKTSFRIWPFAY